MSAAFFLDRPVPVRLTADDFLLLADAGAFQNYAHTELVEGVIVSVNSQLAPHARAKSELAFRLRLAVEALGIDLQIWIEGSVRLGDENVPMPDISLCAPFAITRAPVPGVSLRLAVEVADSTVRYDLNRKAKMYARAEVPEYWVVDLPGNLLHRMTRPGSGGYAQIDQIALGDEVAALTVPDLTVAIDRLT